MTATALPPASLSSPSTIYHAKTYFEMSRARRAIKFSWEQGPMHLVSTSSSAASEATIIHNCIVRALNSIYIQAPHVPMSEYNNFIAYCLSAYDCLSAYLKTNLDAKSKEWGNWLRSIASKRNNFNPEICRGMMDDFMPSLSTALGSSRANVATFLSGLDKATQLPVLLFNHDPSVEGGVHAFPKAGWWTVHVHARKKKEWWKFGTVGGDGEIGRAHV